MYHVSEFKSCIEADQVRVKDEVKTLRKYLAEDAIICVGENIPTLDDALEAQIATFGDTKLLWKKRKDTLSQLLGNSEAWGNVYSIQKISDLDQEK